LLKRALGGERNSCELSQPKNDAGESNYYSVVCEPPNAIRKVQLSASS
jgi:hypothetical protein